MYSDEFNGIYLVSICELLNINTHFKNFLYSVKRTISKDIINSDLYLEIINRIRVFKDMDSHMLDDKLVESTCDHINRVLFTNRSSPCKSDYRELLNSINKDCAQIISVSNVVSDICRYYPIESEKERQKSEELCDSSNQSFISLTKQSSEKKKIVAGCSNIM